MKQTLDALAATAVAVLLTGVANGQTTTPETEEAPAFTWPAFKTLRFEEDYSGLAGVDPIPARTWADNLKFIPLSDDETVWMSFGGQARWRYEGFNNFAFGGINTSLVFGTVR